MSHLFAQRATKGLNPVDALSTSLGLSTRKVGQVLYKLYTQASSYSQTQGYPQFILSYPLFHPQATPQAKYRNLLLTAPTYPPYPQDLLLTLRKEKK